MQSKLYWQSQKHQNVNKISYNILLLIMQFLCGLTYLLHYLFKSPTLPLGQQSVLPLFSSSVTFVIQWLRGNSSAETQPNTRVVMLFYSSRLLTCAHFCINHSTSWYAFIIDNVKIIEGYRSFSFTPASCLLLVSESHWDVNQSNTNPCCWPRKRHHGGQADLRHMRGQATSAFSLLACR